MLLASRGWNSKLLAGTDMVGVAEDLLPRDPELESYAGRSRFPAGLP